MKLTAVYNSKIQKIRQLKYTIAAWHIRPCRVVFTNGCFDILHIGHIQYLQEAKSLGDKLVVGINSDSSVKRLKGEDRPINNETDRAMVMAALGVVDGVIIFDEDTPLQLITELNPDILVKGGDWPLDKIVGAEYVINNGGEVFSLPFISGYSTSNIIQKIKEL
ncbi:MAG TPA: D-glycero-beta-D-manno-heptose 1-phosphate adenylyltransferase [Saprospiraceae bacterium]|nr:D-glycero-beta-D-manno-heptose 1-phosphate adenylyltransferase [Saprospiraceae bacterium]